MGASWILTWGTTRCAVVLTVALKHSLKQKFIWATQVLFSLLILSLPRVRTQDWVSPQESSFSQRPPFPQVHHMCSWSISLFTNMQVRISSISQMCADRSPHPRTPFAGALCNWYSATQGTAVPMGRDPVTLIHCMDIAFINTEGLNTSKYYKWNHQEKIQCDFNSNNTFFDWGRGIPASDVKFEI